MWSGEKNYRIVQRYEFKRKMTEEACALDGDQGKIMGLCKAFWLNKATGFPYPGEWEYETLRLLRLSHLGPRLAFKLGPEKVTMTLLRKETRECIISRKE